MNRVNLADKKAFPALGTAPTAPKKVAWAKPLAVSAPKSKPAPSPSRDNVMAAYWLAQFDAIGDVIYGEITCTWDIRGTVDYSDVNEKEMWDDFIFELTKWEDHNPAFLEKIMGCKKSYEALTKKTLARLRIDPIPSVTPAQLFRARWFREIDDRIFARSTYSFARDLVGSGRRDYAEMAEAVWRHNEAGMTKADRESWYGGVGTDLWEFGMEIKKMKIGIVMRSLKKILE
jgi:hypothetical protein